MNTDERLEALIGRHEALAQSMELTHHDIQDLLAASRLHALALEKDGEHIRALARIAEAHERRIERMEDQP